MGLKEAAVASNGLRCNARWYRRLEEKIAVAQRARHKEQIKRLHAKIKNSRKDAQLKFSTAVIRSASAVYVGNVPVKLLTSGNHAKSGYDAGIYSLKRMLRYKCEHAGIDYREVSEAFSTQVCSACGALPPASPKGRADLGVRHWVCCNCGTLHDRDFNAACNIALSFDNPSINSGQEGRGIAHSSRNPLSSGGGGCQNQPRSFGHLAAATWIVCSHVFASVRQPGQRKVDGIACNEAQNDTRSSCEA